MDVPYKFKIRVTLPDKTQTEESMTVSEPGTQFGEAFACGKVVRYYDGLKDAKQIVDYRILY